MKRKRGNVYANLTQIVFRDVTFFLQENTYWLTPFADSFVNSDWQELVIYFHTNKQDVKQIAFIVIF